MRQPMKMLETDLSANDFAAVMDLADRLWDVSEEIAPGPVRAEIHEIASLLQDLAGFRVPL